MGKSRGGLTTKIHAAVDALGNPVRLLLTQGQEVIPSRQNRLQVRPLDRDIYKDRNLVERFFQKLKQFRRIATRYERLAKNYQSMLSLVSAVIWLT